MRKPSKLTSSIVLFTHLSSFYGCGAPMEEDDPIGEIQMAILKDEAEATLVSDSKPDRSAFSRAKSGSDEEVVEEQSLALSDELERQEELDDSEPMEDEPGGWTGFKPWKALLGAVGMMGSWSACASLPVVRGESVGLIGYFEGDCPDGWEPYQNLVGRFAIGAGDYIGAAENGRAETATYEIGDKGGEIRHALTTDEGPNHHHSTGVEALYNFYGGGDYVRKTEWENGHYDLYSNADTSSSGSNSPHNNMPPYIVLRSCQKTKEDNYVERNDFITLKREVSKQKKEIIALITVSATSTFVAVIYCCYKGYSKCHIRKYQNLPNPTYETTLYGLQLQSQDQGTRYSSSVQSQDQGTRYSSSVQSQDQGTRYSSSVQSQSGD